MLVAKLAMVELAGGMGYNKADASFTGPGRTPWNPDYWSGGSSSGPGAAVAAGLVPFAIGSETCRLHPHSLRFLRRDRAAADLRARLPLRGDGALVDAGQARPDGRTADDCGLVLSAIAGRDAADPTTVEAPRLPKLSGKPRIGVLKGATEFTQPEVASAFEESLALLSRFAEVTRDVVLPDLPYGMLAGTIVDGEGGSAFLELIESGGLRELRAKADRVGGYASAMLPAVDYIHALRIREKVRRPFAELFQKFDLLAAPTRPTVAFPISVDFDKAFPELAQGRPENFVSPSGALISSGNLVGYPAISLPNGFGREGLPTGLQLLAAPFREETLVAAAGELQRQSDFHQRRPVGY